MLDNLKSIIFHPKYSIKWTKLWDNYIYSILNKNNSANNIHPVRNSNFYRDYTGLYSKNRNITVMFSIDGFFHEMNIDYRTELRRVCRQGVRVNFINNMVPYEINLEDKQSKNKFRVWSSVDKNIQESGIDEYNYAENMSKLDETQLRKESLTYISKAVRKRRRQILKMQQIMLVSGERGEDFDYSLGKVISLCKEDRLGIKITRITGDIDDYLKVYSPFSLISNNHVERKVGTNTLPDEILSRFNTYSQGKVGKGSLYWGSDIENQFPVLSEPKKNDTDAEIILVLAETGGGKSFEVKALLPQLLARDDMVGTINDIENEYTELGYLVSASGTDKVQMVDLGSDQGRYFDAVEINLTGDEELDSLMYEDSYNFTVAVFQALGVSDASLKREDLIAEWSTQIIKTGVSNMYSRAGVRAEDQSSWKNSKGLRYQSVYEEIKKVKGDNKDFKQAKDLLMAKLDSYFAEGGAHRGKFNEDKRITLNEIIDAKLVINQFGLKGKSSENLDPVKMSLMSLFTTQIGHLRAVFAKSRGQFNFKVFEEVQRWVKMKGAADLLNSTITGERKIGTITIVISNKASELLNDDALGVFENFTTIAVGAISDAKVRRQLTERIDMNLILPELDEIAKQSKLTAEDVNGASDMSQDDIEANPYAKAFFVFLDRSEYAICKMRLPKNIRESKLYKTGVKETEDSY